MKDISTWKWALLAMGFFTIDRGLVFKVNAGALHWIELELVR